MSARYSFRSIWNIDAPVTEVWTALTEQPFSWESWWPELTNVQILHAPRNLKGTHFTCSWKAPIGYKLMTEVTITDIKKKREVTLGTSGDLKGTVICTINENGGATRILITWNVATTKSWMNRLSPLLRPLFIWSHHRVMRSGEQGLRRYIKQTRP